MELYAEDELDICKILINEGHAVNIGVAKKQKYGHSMKISAEGISLIKKFEGY